MARMECLPVMRVIPVHRGAQANGRHGVHKSTLVWETTMPYSPYLGHQTP